MTHLPPTPFHLRDQIYVFTQFQQIIHTQFASPKHRSATIEPLRKPTLETAIRGEFLNSTFSLYKSKDIYEAKLVWITFDFIGVFKI